MHREKVFINGQEAPSVTQVLGIIRKPFLEKWRGAKGNAECDRIADAAREIGTAFHDAVEGYFRGDIAQDLPDDVARMFSLFKGWAIDSRCNPVELELVLESKTYGYHGACDAIVHFEDSTPLVMVDWKTSSSMSKDYALQLAAYAHAYKEQTGVEITEGLIVRLDKKPKAKKLLEVKRYGDLSSYFPTFLHALELYRFVNGKDK